MRRRTARGNSAVLLCKRSPSPIAVSGTKPAAGPPRKQVRSVSQAGRDGWLAERAVGATVQVLSAW